MLPRADTDEPYHDTEVAGMSRTMESLESLFARVVAEDRRKYDVIADTRSMNVGVDDGRGQGRRRDWTSTRRARSLARSAS